MDSKIITAVVVVSGIIALAACAKFGVEKETIAGLAATLLVLAGSMKGAKS
jgi:hypothetical protein